MLEGESLLNDATSLVLLRTVIAAIAVATACRPAKSAESGFSPFVWGVLIAVVVGGARRLLALRVRALVATRPRTPRSASSCRSSPTCRPSSWAAPASSPPWSPGIVTGQGAARWFTPEQRLSDELNWRTVELMLEGAVFLVMGLQLKEIVRRRTSRTTKDSGTGMARARPRSAIILVVARRLRRAPRLAAGPARPAAAARRRLESLQQAARRDRGATDGPRDRDGRRRGPDPTPSAGQRRLDVDAPDHASRVRGAGDLDYYQASPLGWKHGTVIVWAGMRGVVTLAAAQTLPEAPRPGAAGLRRVPVAVGSLMLQGFTLPWLVRLLRLERPGGRRPRPRRAVDASTMRCGRPRHPLTGRRPHPARRLRLPARARRRRRHPHDPAARRRHDRVRATTCSNCASP